jgi:hypothetical protein
MKSTEIKLLWKLVKAGEKRPLSAADLRLLMRIRSALMDYKDEVKLGQGCSHRGKADSGNEQKAEGQ